MKRKAAAALAGLLAASMLFAACGAKEGNTAPATEETGKTTEVAETDLAGEDAADDKAGTADQSDDTSDASASALPNYDDLPADFTYLINSAVDTVYYESYNDNPVAKYWLGKEWDADGDGTGRKITIDFIAPPAGSEGDNINTLIATGEYPDIMDLSHSSQSAVQLYDEGILLDITEYVETYMPNYMSWIKEHDYYNYLTNEVDGERRFIQLYDVCDQTGEFWGGFIYRRDWIVRYGKNPKTGKAFTGAYNEEGVWEDDVVFPSGGDEPIYISDWEWMLDIFATALKEQGITDGYPMSIPYSGAFLTGEMVSAFGISPMWYIGEDGTCHFGGYEDGMRAYLECVSQWYKNGWIDPYFEEHSNDNFFMIDQTTLYSGKVGLFYGLTSQLGSTMDVSGGDTSNPTNGIVCFGARQPINDKYGDASMQNKEPAIFLSGSLANTTLGITNKAEEKNIASLLTALDYLYTLDGGMLRNVGFSKEEMAEIQDEFYLQWGLEDGAYEKVVSGDDYTYVINKDALTAETGLDGAASMQRVLGMTTMGHVDHGRKADEERSVMNWSAYSTTGNIPPAVSRQLSADQATNHSAVQSAMITYYGQEMPGFVTGTKDISDDAEWEAFCDGLKELGVDTYCEDINAVIGK